MKILLTIANKYIINKNYNIHLLRIFMLICTVFQLLIGILPIIFKLPLHQQVIQLCYLFVVSAITLIGGYVIEVTLFYWIFKKYVNKSWSLAEKQIAPLLCVRIVIIPFVFNLAGQFARITYFHEIIYTLQWIATILYLGYLSCSKVFESKCTKQALIYLVISFVFEVICYVLKLGISV